MQLLVYITNEADRMPKVLSSLMKVGVNGATVVRCEGMLHMLASLGDDAAMPAFFNSAMRLFDDNLDHGKMMLAVMPDELIMKSKQAIKDICGGFDRPNTGIMFTVPVMHFEGVSKG